MKCLILGGSGFIGSHLIRALRRQGHEVLGYSRHKPGASAVSVGGEAPWVIGDLANRVLVADALRGIDICFHLISTTLPKTSNDDPVNDIQTNVCDTVALLQEAITAKVRRFVFISSGGTVYGVPKCVPIDETHVLEPTSSYGIGKLAIEHYLRLFHALHGLNHVILRLSNPFGPGQNPNRSQGAVSVFLQRVLQNREIEIWGDGSVVRDYVYIEDAIQGILAATNYSGAERTFNIGSGTGRSLNQLIEMIEVVSGKRARVRYLPKRDFDVPANILSVTLAARVLGYRPTTSFESGLLRTLHWLQASSA
jgi:UDP-glucose 4-epimerase